MADKEQIMINGVDVSGCEYLTYQLEEDGQYYWFCKISPTGGPDECEYNPECFYKRVLKQLTCKTQECEELKKNCEERKLASKQMRDSLCQEVSQKLKLLATLKKIEKVIKINCEEICGRKFEDCNDFLCTSKNILDIINKVKDGNNE